MQAQYTPYKKPESGKILIAEPFLKDAYFSRSVVLLAEHNTEGSFGLIINKPISNLKVSEVIKDFPQIDCPVYLGGPVKNDSVFYIHSCGELIENSTRINDNLYFGGDVEQIKEMIMLNKISGNEIKFYIGYSGWNPKQLEKELKEKSWLVVDCKNHNFLEDTPQVLWNNILKKMGNEYMYWSLSPIDPQLN